MIKTEIETDEMDHFFTYYMGRELNVCGDLIYKGFEALENNKQPILISSWCEKLSGADDYDDYASRLQESPAFIFWIDTSIAFERLGKIIALFLMQKKFDKKYRKGNSYSFEEKDDDLFDDTPLFEKYFVPSLSEKETDILNTHNNEKIYNYLATGLNGELKLDKEENALLEKITSFYKNLRYGRFHEKKESAFNQEVIMLHDLYKKAYDNGKKKIYMCRTQDEIAMFHVGRLISSMAKKYYGVIQKLSEDKGLFTWELHDDGLAARVFWESNESIHELFIWNRVARNETLYSLMYDKIKKHCPNAPDKLKTDAMGLDFKDIIHGYAITNVDGVQTQLWDCLFKESDDKEKDLDEREQAIERLISRENKWRDY